METADLLKRVRKIEIKSRGLSNQIFSGEYQSAFKGRGMAFSEVREYMPGDEIRTIDWNVTARFNHPYVKVFEEERELTVMLVVDVSASRNFGSKEQLKRDLITELCAVLAFSAINNNDKIGLILFTDQVEKFIKPAKGRKHTLRIIRELIEFKPESKGTDVGEAIRYLTHAIKKRSTAFLISDFIDNSFSEPLKIGAKKHDLVALEIKDEAEETLPNIGLVPIQDLESGKMTWIDSSNRRIRKEFEKRSLEREAYLKASFAKAGVDRAVLKPGQSYVRPLMTLFRKRES